MTVSRARWTQTVNTALVVVLWALSILVSRELFPTHDTTPSYAARGAPPSEAAPAPNRSTKVTSLASIDEFATQEAQAYQYAALVFDRVRRGESSSELVHRDVVLVAAWRRPEFLLMSLSHVVAAKHFDEHEYIFIFDWDYDPISLAVAKAFPGTHTRMHFSPRHEFIEGNSFNVLEGYRYAHMIAHSLGSSLVYLLEEDVWISADYFSFHRLAHAHDHVGTTGMSADDASRVFQVVGFSIPLNSGQFGEDRAAAVAICSADTAAGELLRQTVVLRRHYTSIATSFDTGALDYIARHATKRYYEDPGGHCYFLCVALSWGSLVVLLPVRSGRRVARKCAYICDM